MPKEQLSHEVENTAAQRASLDQRRENMESASKGLPAGRHTTEKQELQAAQDILQGKCRSEDAQKLESLLAGQQKQLELRQSVELSLINSALSTADHMEKNGATGPERAKELLDVAAKMNEAIRETFNGRIREELAELTKALATPDAGTRNELIEDIKINQPQTEEYVKRDLRNAEGELQRRDALSKNILDGDQRNQLTATVREATENEQARKIFTSQGIQRIADEVLSPGKERLDKVEMTSAIQRAKGEIAERMAGDNARAQIQIENKNRSADQQLFLIEGDRIRDEQGKKLSDGLIVWRDADNTLQIWKALEVKSGAPAARELNEKVEKLTKAQDAELQKYARDLAQEEAAKLVGLTDAQRQVEIDRIQKEEEANLRSRAVQKESGQREQTTERLDLTERIYIDGKSQEIAIDKERRLGDIVLKVVTDEALKRDLEVHRLGIEAKELEKIAQAFVEELLRQDKL